MRSIHPGGSGSLTQYALSRFGSRTRVAAVEWQFDVLYRVGQSCTEWQIFHCLNDFPMPTLNLVGRLSTYL